MLVLAGSGCSNTMPPPIADSDASFHEWADVFIPPQPVEASADGGLSFNLDFQAQCSTNYEPVWHFFDFQTHTPGTSSLEFVAYTADTEAHLATATGVKLATVTGPDITVWEGVDVASALATQNIMSQAFLRVTVIETPSSDGTDPVLVNYRQAFDCDVYQ